MPLNVKFSAYKAIVEVDAAFSYQASTGRKWDSASIAKKQFYLGQSGLRVRRILPLYKAAVLEAAVTAFEEKNTESLHLEVYAAVAESIRNLDK